VEGEAARHASATGPGRRRLFAAAGSRVYGSEPCPVRAGAPGSVPAAQAAFSVLITCPFWAEVAGGVLPAGRWRSQTGVADLLWTAVPVTVSLARQLGELPEERGGGSCTRHPVTGITWHQAVRLAASLGGRLPTSAEWEWMAGRGSRRYPWGDDPPRTETASALANLRGIGPDRTTTVGEFPAGATPDGLLDVAGNVWEWTSTPVPGGRVVRGGSYRALSLYARCDYVNEVPPEIASPGIGVRVVRES
jgi:sulfatase modifying factor 1